MRRPIILLFLLYCTGVPAQDYETHALQAYLSGDLTEWDTAIRSADGITDKQRRLLVQSEYYLSKAYAAMAREEEDIRDAAMESIDDKLDALWGLNDGNAEAHGVFAGLLGLKIARSPISAMVHGSRAGKYAAKGVKLAPDNPVALYHAAANLYFTPEQWGGDREKAARYLEHALEQYGPDRDQNFRYLGTLALLGQVQADLGNTEGARITYRRALEAQPRFVYVSRVLLPQLDK